MIRKASHTIMNAALVALICGFVVDGRSTAQAQFAEQDCIPRKEAEGPWKCKPENINGVVCLRESEFFVETWQPVVSQYQAFARIKSRYVEIGDARKFAIWLTCQGFRVSAFEQILKGSEPKELRRDLFVRAEILRATFNPFPLPFWKRIIGLGSVQTIYVAFDPYGEVRSIELTDQY